MILDELLIHVLPYVPGCSASMAKRHLLNAAREWCRDTEIWQADLLPLITRAGRVGYALNTERHQEVVKINWVYVDTEKCRLVAAAAAQTILDEFRLNPDQVACAACWTTNREDVNLHPSPTTDGQLIRINAVLMPSKNAEELAEEVIGRHEESIAAGALGRLLSMPKEDWTDMDAASMWMGQFIDAKQRALFEVAHGFGRLRLRVRSAP
jgi:hypothetical protein